jgi:hypothetical protein
MKNLFLFSCVFFFSTSLLGQTPSLNHFYKNYYSKSFHHLDSNFHTAVQPYNSFEVQSIIDSAFQNIIKKKDGFLYRKLFNEDLIQIKGKDFNIRINPLFNLSYGKSSDRSNVNTWRNGRGIQVIGELGSQIMFYSDFLENQAQFPGYVHQFIGQNNVVPGEGGVKVFKNKGAKDFAHVSSFISYQAKKFFNFEFGYGKNFFGDGFRSMLLSDNSFNYPYFKINTTFWRIKYTNLYSQMLDIRSTNQSGTYIKKYVSSHHLSINIGKRFNVGLFESIVYQDSSGTRGYELSYLNPIIFYRPVEFSLGSGGGNALIGLNVKYQLSNKQFLYGQILLDEFNLNKVRAKSGWWGNKFGVQLGFKSFDTFIPNLTFQTEFNMARPYTYSHTKALQNYGHYNQPLAHTLGSNFVESISIIHYYRNRVFAEMKFMYAVKGLDEEGSNWGGNIYIDNREREMSFGNETLQGIKSTTLFVDVKVGYLVNPNTNLRVELGFVYRNFNPEIEIENITALKTNYAYFGLVSRIKNNYNEF